MRLSEETTMDILGDWQRTHHCGELRAGDAGQEALLMGWVNTRRDLGNLIFVDLRDREGVTQVVFDPQVNTQSHEEARALRNEWVIAVQGTVSRRPEGQENPHLPTGEIELKVTELRILSRSQTPPFQVDGAVDASEALRLKYRYLELRRPEVFRLFRKRHQIAAAIRSYLDQQGFVDVETPFLTKSTPEGARDYLVPSRTNRGMFYALPQSPQLFKQLLMISGFDRYYQVVRCFRDEDLRADRQPEFTQVDLEMAFADEGAVMGLVEGMIQKIFHEVLGVHIPIPIVRLEYQEAMDCFGTDKPDLRFGMELCDVTEASRNSEFVVFKTVAEEGGVVKSIRVRQASEAFSRKQLDQLGQDVTRYGAKGLAWIKIKPEGWQSSLNKFFPDEAKAALNEQVKAEPGDLVLLLADRPEVANRALGALRLELAKRLRLVKEDTYAFAWITKFPLLEYDPEEGRLEPVHHPFTCPLVEDIPLLDRDPKRARARAYDLVLNGEEIGGGSVRIHDPSLQEKMFKILRISPKEARNKFGFFLEALKYGAPPHAGVALGFDRLVAIMAGASSIREVIAFPKTTSATCLLTDAPSRVNEAQLRELGIALVRNRLRNARVD